MVSAKRYAGGKTGSNAAWSGKPVSSSSRCLIPGFDGAVFSHEWKDAPWARFSTVAPQRQRQSVERYSINPKTVAKWRGRNSVQGMPAGPKQAQSTVLSPEDEAVVVAFRRHTCCRSTIACMPLQATIPHLTRSSLHRCLQRHGISRLPDVESATPGKRKFKTYPLGYFQIDIAEVHTAQGRLYLLVAIDHFTKFAFIELHEKATRSIAGDFLCALIKAVPYAIHTVLTANGTHFTSPGNVCSVWMFSGRCHRAASICTSSVPAASGLGRQV